MARGDTPGVSTSDADL